MEAYKREFIQFLQDAGVLKFGDFTAKSGRKIPYFINAGMIKTGDQITKMGEFYAKAYFDKLGKKSAVLYGPAYKGISLSISAAVALSKNGLNVPFFFNRKEVKDHGEGGTFVGYVPQAGEEIVIIEDVITAGTAIRESMEILKHLEGTRVIATFIMVDRKEKGQSEKGAMQEIEDKTGLIRRFEQMRGHLNAIQAAVESIRSLNDRLYEDPRLRDLTDQIEREAAALRE